MLGKLKATEYRVMRGMDNVLEITFKVPPVVENTRAVENIMQQTSGKDKPLSVSVDWHRNKRSIDANAYMWVLCEKIAQATSTTKEEVYRQNVLEVGVFEPMPVHEDALGKWKRIWEERGTAWICQVVDDSKLPGYKLTHNYYGSSTYSTAEMYRLIQAVIQDAKALDIETMTPRELDELLNRWSDGIQDKTVKSV